MLCQNCQAEMPRMNYCGSCGHNLFEDCPVCGQREPIKREGCLKNIEEEKQRVIEEAKDALGEFSKQVKEKATWKLRLNAVAMTIAVCSLQIFFVYLRIKSNPDLLDITNWVAIFLVAVFAYLVYKASGNYLTDRMDKKNTKRFAECYPEQMKILGQLDSYERSKLKIYWL